MNCHTAKSPESATHEINEVHLPEGLVGFSELNSVEIVYSENNLPFMWMRDKDDSGLSFLVIEPMWVLSEYEIELYEQDKETLELQTADDALVLLILTVGKNNQNITANLIGPVVINRKTQTGKQVLICNNKRFSARHVLLDNNKEIPIDVDTHA